MNNPINTVRIVRDYLDGKLSPEERTKFLDVMRSSQDEVALSTIHEAIFEQIDQLSPSELQLLEQKLKHEQFQPKASAVVRMRALFRYAAAVLLVASLALSIRFLVFKQAEHTVYVTDTQKREVITLADGSEVILAPSGRIEVTMYNDSIRSIQLSGKAVFTVVPSKTPFIVHTAEGYFTKVLGTKFTVSSMTDNAYVEVERGKVEVGMNDESYGVLYKGDKIRFGETIQIDSHQENPLEFNHARLAHVIATINELYDGHIQLQPGVDPDAMCKLTIEKTSSIIDIVETLCDIHGYSYRIAGDNIVIYTPQIN